MPRFPVALAVLLAAPVLSFAQDAPAKPAPPKPGAKAKPSKEPVPGYKKMTVEGFTLFVSEEVLTADVTKFDRPPMDVLTLELKMIVKLLPAKGVELLRNVPMWVEWDEKENVQNGRAGYALAVYNGGSQLAAVQNGKHPLKGKSVTILSMASLTAEHQPKTDSGRCVLLHELAHAVHDQLVGMQNPAVTAAYRQAMERKLYDKDKYITTNEAEYFAEATCAYFDQLAYFPRTRDDLRKHDPQTLKLMEAVWAVPATARKPDPTAKPAKGPGDSGAGKYDLGVTLADAKFGESLHGQPVSADALAGKVVVVAYWGTNDSAVLPRLIQVAQELTPYDTRVVVVRTGEVEVDRAKEEMAAREVEMTVVGSAEFKEKGAAGSKPPAPPHAMVFNPDGTCAFRGSGYDALPHARAAAGRKLVADLKADELPKGFAPAADALTRGEPLLAALPKITPLAANPDAATAAAAKALLAALTAPGQEAFAEAQKTAKANPVEAYFAVEKIPTTYKGSPLAVKAAALAQSLKFTPAVAAELRARAILTEVQKLDTYLVGQPGSFDPTNSAFQQKNAAALAELKAHLEKLRKKYPTARATTDAEKIAKTYSVN